MIQVRIDLPPVPASLRSHKRFLKWNAVDSAGNVLEQAILAKETDLALFVQIDAESFEAASFQSHLEFTTGGRQRNSTATVAIDKSAISHTVLVVESPEEDSKPATKRRSRKAPAKAATETPKRRGRPRKPKAEAPEQVVDVPEETPEPPESDQTDADNSGDEPNPEGVDE